MLQENLQINIGANTQDLQAGLNQATNSVNNFSNSVQKAAKPTADATNALGNLSRVAQDAPYGFMGIANNLNPLLESFQRLQKESGGAGNALKAMVGGLMGPAGLGLALGVVSSLVVKFGDDIGEFFAKLSSGGPELAETNKAFSESKDAFTKAYVEMQKLGDSFESFHNGTKSKKDVLDEYNKTLGKVYGTTNNLGEAEKLYVSNSEAYVKAAMYRAAAQVALQKAAEQAFKQQELANNPKAAGGGADIGGTIGAALLSKFVGADVMSASQAGAFQAATDKAKTLESTYLKIADSFNSMVSQTNAAAEKSVLFGKEDKRESKTKSIAGVSAKSLEDRLKEAMDFIDKEQGQLVKGPKEAEGGSNKILLNALTGETGQKQDEKKLSESKKEMDKFFKDNEKNLEQARKSAEGFADTLSKDITGGLMSMWDAMEKGENPLKALGNFFKDLLKQLAAAVIQAILFKTIMTALGFGAASGGGGIGGGLLGGIGKIFGFAEGGIVSQPTMAMVGEGGQSEAIMPLNKLGNMMNSTFNAGAMSGTGGGGGNGQFTLKGNDLVLALQRSNYSLNLRRGS
jgi:hypothetical protein